MVEGSIGFGSPRLLVVGAHAPELKTAGGLRGLTDWTVTTRTSYLDGIVEGSGKGFDGVLLAIDPAHEQLDACVAGYRSAIGDGARLVLACAAEHEPIARRAMQSGADSYVLLPLERKELVEALDIHEGSVPEASPGAMSLDEFSSFVDLMGDPGEEPRAWLGRLADLVRQGMHARGATVVVEGAVAHSGERVSQPVVTAGLYREASCIGQVSVSAREGRCYTASEAGRLDHYAQVVGRLVSAMSTQRQWRKMALTDECSGLPNRRCLLQRLDEVLGEAGRGRFSVSVLLYDVDNFKSFNDRYGHQTGDEILKVAGELFRAHCREQDIVARYGGDEFAVVFWDPTGPRVAGSAHPNSALSVFDRVREELRQTHLASLAEPAELTISGGVATYPWDGVTGDALLASADKALLAAKRGGKNRVYVVGEGEERD